MDNCFVLPLRPRRVDNDAERTFSAFLQLWPLGLLFLVYGVGVCELELSFSDNFEAIVEVCPRGKRLGPKAGTGIIHFNKL